MNAISNCRIQWTFYYRGSNQIYFSVVIFCIKLLLPLVSSHKISVIMHRGARGMVACIELLYYRRS